jgi:hypothetical protein
MTFILFVVACLQSQPGQCVGERIDLPEVTTATGCHLVGNLRLAQWQREHAEMHIKEANCMAKPSTITAGGKL